MTILAKARNAVRRLRHDRRGNVMMILGFAMIPMTFAVGFGIDYSRAMKLKARMDAAADAAALAAVNITMMEKTDAEARDAAKKMFIAQVRGLPGLPANYDWNDPSHLTIDIPASSGGFNTGRTVTVTYTVPSLNVFGGILNTPTLPVQGGATANATRAPNINFYLLMDTSPSMLLPSTSNGLNAIRTATSTSHLTKGCAFACHTQNPHDDNIYVRNAAGNDIWLDSTGKAWPVSKVQNGNVYTKNAQGVDVKVAAESSGHYADAYWLTRNYSALFGGDNITLRIDEEQAAAQNLIPFAITTAANNKVTYKLQLFTFDWTHPGKTHPVNAVTTSMNDVNNMATYTVPNFYNQQDYWYKNSKPTASTDINDQATEVHNALVRMNTVMPDPGDGSTSDKAQQVLFIITDGIVDESQGGNRRNREWSTGVNLKDCTTIKNRGIRIAILYTEYLPESLEGDSWSQTNVAPYLPNVEPQLKSCASARSDGTPLYYKVTTDQSISEALAALFSLTVQAAHLIR